VSCEMGSREGRGRAWRWQPPRVGESGEEGGGEVHTIRLGLKKEGGERQCDDRHPFLSGVGWSEGGGLVLTRGRRGGDSGVTRGGGWGRGLASGIGPELAEVGGTWPVQFSASWQGRRGWRGPGRVGRYGPTGVGRPQRKVMFFHFHSNFQTN
jgi:hypothetical protein